MYTSVVFVAVLAVANAGLISHSIIAPISHGTTLVGPGTKTAITGPDGSHIVAAAPGGVVSTAAHGAVVAPVVAAHAAPVYAAPIVASHAVVAPVVARAVPVNPAFVAHGPHGALIAPGTGLEGQYQHDYTETLYDDGQYRGEFLNGHH